MKLFKPLTIALALAFTATGQPAAYPTFIDPGGGDIRAGSPARALGDQGVDIQTAGLTPAFPKRSGAVNDGR